MSVRPWLLGVCALALTTRVCSAAPITYAVNQVIGVGSVTGTITTDGATGPIGTGDITAWNLLLRGSGGTSLTLTNHNSGVFETGSDVSATPTDLYFNFSAVDGGYLLFQVSFGNGLDYYCNKATVNGTCYEGKSVVPISYNDPTSQFAPAIGNQVIGIAGGGPIPEPATVSLLAMSLIGVGLAKGGRRG